MEPIADSTTTGADMYTSLLKYSVICLALTVSAAAAAAPAPIVFFDIAGPDAAKLKTFYGANFGWTIDPTGGIATPHLPGTFRQDPPETLIYLAVPDIGAALKGILASGGSVVMPRMVVPNVVTFAIFKDPAGNRMGLVERK
jgi:predicted enzyme related to lactoylglutathione lyase